MNSLDFTLNRFFMKLFKTSDMAAESEPNWMKSGTV